MPTILTLGPSASPHFRRWVLAMQGCGYEIHCVSYDGAAIPGLSVINLPRKSIGKLSYLWYVRQVAEIAQTVRPDIIHAHFATSYGMWGAALKRRFPGVPFIITAWGSDITQSIRRPFLRALLKRNFRRADYTTAMSEFLGREIAEWGLFDPARLAIIPLGLTFDELPIYERPNSDSVRLLFFKHLETIYGPDILLRALAQARGMIPHIPLALTMAGKGSQDATLKELAQTLGLAAVVTFPGFVPPDQALQCVAGHDIMVMPTVVPESFGMAALESSAYSVPVIASDIGGIPEIVINEKTGLLVRPRNVEALANAIVRLAANRVERLVFGRAAAIYVREEYNWSRSVERMDTLYRHCLENRGATEAS